MRVNCILPMVPGGYLPPSLSLLLLGKLRHRKEKWLTQHHIVDLQLHLLVLQPVLGPKNGSLISYSPNGRVNSSGPAVFTFSFPRVGVQMMCVACSGSWKHRKRNISLKILKVCLGHWGFWRGTAFDSILGGINSVPVCASLPSLPLPHRYRKNMFALQHIVKLD